MQPSLPRAVLAQLSAVHAALQEHLDPSLLAVHLFGSAVAEGLKPRSDIDLLVTVTERPSKATRHALMQGLLSLSAPPGSHPSLRALEVTVLAHAEVVPWRYPPQRELQFGEWLRADLEAGIHEDPQPDPDLALLLHQARCGSVALLGSEAAALFNPVPQADLRQALRETVAQWNTPADWEGDERNIVLALARIWYTAATGQIASKDGAAQWLIDREQRPGFAVLAKARAAYLGDAEDDLSREGAQVASFIADARQAIEALLGPAQSTG